jgi:hypothetical protein
MVPVPEVKEAAMASLLSSEMPQSGVAPRWFAACSDGKEGGKEGEEGGPKEAIVMGDGGSGIDSGSRDNRGSGWKLSSKGIVMRE